MGILEGLRDALHAQRGGLLPWTPVMFAIGIGVFFTLKQEPSLWVLGGSFGFSIALFFLAWRTGSLLGPGLVALGIVGLGISVAGIRANLLAGPVMNFRYYGPIEGRVIGIDRAASGAMRLTLDQVRLKRVRATPHRVRISLHGPAGALPEPGGRVMTTGHLFPPPGPVEPTGFNFRRHAWFLQIGAVGYTRIPVLVSQRPDGSQTVFAFRMALSRAVQKTLPGEAGAFAAAITTGDRSGMRQDTQQILRDANLAHLLAISGLHMGLLAGLVFGALRLAIAAVPPIALRIASRKLAAMGAFLAAAAYLALSGGNIATERAFVMVTVALAAIILDRRVISLRAVAVAALIVLTLRPEALMSPGFQMSFAATTALIACFARLRLAAYCGPRWLRPVLALVLSSLVAGIATAPFAAAHFNRFAQFGLIANLLTVPLMGLLIMPAAILAASLAPFGLEGVPLWIMGKGLQWILSVAETVAAWDGAIRHVPAPSPIVLPSITLGACFSILWRGRSGLLGGAVVLAGLLLWVKSDRPDILIAESGQLVGIQIGDARALSRKNGAGLAARIWLENDGDGTDQMRAASRWPNSDQGLAWAELHGVGKILHAVGKRARSDFPGCGPGDIAIFNGPVAMPLDCKYFTPDRLKKTGAVAIWLDDDGLRFDTTSARAGARLWSRPGQ